MDRDSWEWTDGDFHLVMWDTNQPLSGRTYLGYEFRCKGELIFSGEDIGCPRHVAIDSDESISACLYWIALRPGDTDAIYFANYTPEQLAFAEQRGEELAMLAMQLAAGAKAE